jgi:hypothetical protein
MNDKERLATIEQKLREMKKNYQDVVDLGVEYFSYERIKLAKNTIVEIDEILKGEKE